MEGVEGGMRAPVGSYNRVAWMKREGVYKSGEKYYKLIQLADSSTAWKEVDLPPRYSRAPRRY
jgi:hypothetical protein